MSIPTKSTGKLIVLDGSDGTGKATQTALLIKRLRNEGHRVAMMDFPQYGKPSATFIEAYLNGKFGNAEEVGPYTASLFFALDRYAARPSLERHLAAGRIIVANRYVTANMGHQGGKIDRPRERRQFFRWLEDIEFTILGMPRPDRTIILHIPAHIAQTLVDRKKPRAYIKGKKRDLLEADLEHLVAAEKTYLDIARTLPNTTLIECVEHQRLLTPEEIHEKIWKHVQEIL